MTRNEASAGSGGIEFAQNARFTTEGEFQRRHGLEYATGVGAWSLVPVWTPTGGYQIVTFTASGTLELVTL